MANFITLHMNRSERNAPRVADPYSDTDEPGEPGSIAESAVTSEARIAVDSIRCYYARHGGATGSRITFKDGGGFTVTESPAEIDAKIGYGG